MLNVLVNDTKLLQTDPEYTLNAQLHRYLQGGHEIQRYHTVNNGVEPTYDYS
jgi:hypothetical protein